MLSPSVTPSTTAPVGQGFVFIRSKEMSSNGLLILTCLSKLTASLSVASKRIVSNLYIHYHPNEPVKREKFSKVRMSSAHFCAAFN